MVCLFQRNGAKGAKNTVDCLLLLNRFAPSLPLSLSHCISNSIQGRRGSRLLQ
jgi:hypothetical protein